MPIGKRVVVVGGLIHGCQLAAFLMKRGRKVTIVEETGNLGEGMLAFHKLKLLKWFEKSGATILTEVQYHEINDRGLTIRTKEGQGQMLEADTIVIAAPPEANPEFFETLKKEVPEVYLSGDCETPGLIVDAIADGFRIGRMI